MIPSKIYKRGILLFLLVSLMIIPAYAISYIDLERITVGQKSTNWGYALNFTLTTQKGQSALGLEDLNFSDTVTLECWFYPYTVTGVRGLVHVGNFVQRTLLSWIENVYYDSTEAFHRDRTGSVFSVKSWFHIVSIYDVDYDYSSKVWINGVEKTVTPVDNWGEPLSATKGGYCLIGNVESGYLGYLDEIRVYNRIINQTEINYSYNTGQGSTPLDQTGLKAWYRLNEGSGNIAHDETAFNHNLTLYNNPSWIQGEKCAIGLTYSDKIQIYDLEASYEIKLYNDTNSLVCNATANNEGLAELTLPGDYLTSSFQGTYRVYDNNGSFLYQKWYEDIKGGDQYEIISEETSLGLAIIGLVLALFALILALSKFG